MKEQKMIQNKLQNNLMNHYSIIQHMLKHGIIMLYVILNLLNNKKIDNI